MAALVTDNIAAPLAERGDDLNETPTCATRALMAADTAFFHRSRCIWEPSCGPGAIVRVLRQDGHHVIATDLVDYGCPDSSGGRDFLLEYQSEEAAEAIVMNPPYKLAKEFVRQARRLVPRTYALLRLGFQEGIGRTDILEAGDLARVFVFRDRLPMMHRAGWTGPRQKKSRQAYAWYLWDRTHRGETAWCRLSAEAAS